MEKIKEILANLPFYLKKANSKFIIIPALVLIVLVVIVTSFDDDEDKFEIQTKFPLEDYLFQDEQKQKAMQEAQQAEINQMQAEIERLQAQLDNQQNQVSNGQKRVLYGNLHDRNGNAIELDEKGEIILYDENGNRIYVDENGKPYRLDANGNKVYLDKNEKVFSKKGTEMARDNDGSVVFADEYGNITRLKDGKKFTATLDGNIIEEDKDGNFVVRDEYGNVLAKGNYNSDENAYGLVEEAKNPNKPLDYNPFTGSPYEKGKNDKYSDKYPKNYYKDKIGEDNEKYTDSGTKGGDKNGLYYDDEGNLIGDRVALENQKFIWEKANDRQKMINDILASRLAPSPKNIKKYEKIYGVDEFENLEEKDDGSNEHKLLRTITADKMIPAFLTRPISSQLGGTITAQVETNIYGAHGRAVLIPKGSKVIGFYQNNNKIGEYRLEIIWTRIITPQGINILLTDGKNADIKGYSGAVGKVYSRNFQRYGIPMTLSTLSNGLLLAVNSLSQKGEAAQSKSAQGEIANAYMQAQILSGMRQDVSGIIQRIVQEQMRIQPIIIIREGSRIFIALSQDIFIPMPKKNETLARFFNEKIEVKQKPRENAKSLNNTLKKYSKNPEMEENEKIYTDESNTKDEERKEDDEYGMYEYEEEN